MSWAACNYDTLSGRETRPGPPLRTLIIGPCDLSLDLARGPTSLGVFIHIAGGLLQVNYSSVCSITRRKEVGLNNSDYRIISYQTTHSFGLALPWSPLATFESSRGGICSST